MDKILLLIWFFYFIYCQDEMLFYHTEKKYCKKNKGICFDCDCWSCKRKELIRKEIKK